MPAKPQAADLVNLFDRFNFGDLFAEVSCDAFLEGVVGGRATDACTVEADAGDTVGRDFHEFKVAAVVLHGRADACEDGLDACVEACALCGMSRGCGRRCGSRGLCGAIGLRHFETSKAKEEGGPRNRQVRFTNTTRMIRCRLEIFQRFAGNP